MLTPKRKGYALQGEGPLSADEKKNSIIKWLEAFGTPNKKLSAFGGYSSLFEIL